MAPKAKGLAALAKTLSGLSQKIESGGSTVETDAEPTYSTSDSQAASRTKPKKPASRTKRSRDMEQGVKERSGKKGRPSKQEVDIQGIAATADLAVDIVKRVFEATRKNAVQRLRNKHEFCIGTLVSLTAKKVKARPATSKLICGRACKLKERAEGHKVHARAHTDLCAALANK